jgi:HSP20 family protein
MNALTRYENKWNPFKEMEELSNRLTALLGRSFGRVPVRTSDTEETLTLSEWAPLVDITEDDKEYLIKAELPEVTKNDLKVTVENGVLQLSGSRKFEKEEKGRRYHRVERAYGSFSRSFTLPDDADPAKVHAEFKDGVLQVHVAKSEGAKPKLIDVKIS